MGMQRSVQPIRGLNGYGCGELGLRKTRRTGEKSIFVDDVGRVTARVFCALVAVAGRNFRERT